MYSTKLSTIRVETYSKRHSLKLACQPITKIAVLYLAALTVRRRDTLKLDCLGDSSWSENTDPEALLIENGHQLKLIQFH